MENIEKMKNPMSSYKTLLLTLLISFFIMYGVMFLNVYDTGDIYISLNRFYMSILMVSPMALIMMGMMRSMFKKRKLNVLIVVIALLLFALAFVGLRTQAFIGDREYMKGMIPHHSSAVLTSSRAHLVNADVRRLADSIIASQKREIAEMKQMIQQLEK